MIISQGHNSRHYGLVDPYFGTLIDKSKVGIGVIKILCDSTISTSPKFFTEPVNVSAIALCFGMNFGIGANINFKIIT